MDTDFDPLDDLLAGGAVKKAKPVGKFQPKAKFRPTKKISSATSVSTSQGVQTIDSTQSELIEPSKHCSDVVRDNNEGSHAFMEKSTVENSEVFIGLGVPGDTDPAVPSSDGRDKKHDAELEREKQVAFDLNKNAENDSVSTLQVDDIIDVSSITHTLPTEATSESPTTEEPNNLEHVREIPTKLATRRAKTASYPSTQQQEDASPSSRENETGRTLRPRKGKSIYELVDEDVELSEECAADENIKKNADEDVELSEECAAVEDENINNDEEFAVESESQTKKPKRKSKKPDDGDKEKQGGRKRKKASSEHDAGAKPKKFSRSTRRTRVVDKALFEIPDEDLDYDTVPLRDLLARAEHIEKQAKKAAPVTKKSNGVSSNHNNEEDETFNSKQGGENDDEDEQEEQGSPIAEDTTENFNYHTYMERTPRSRWSKQDTEMFYNAVSQMGSDLAMIQKLFPERTRRQLKLKYKKEEREHPMRLHDALTSRTKDNSFFKMIIERLEQERKRKQEENRNAGEDDEADEETTVADDEEPKDDEHGQEKENNDVANDGTEVQIPLMSDDDDHGEDDDDEFGWDQYKSV